MPSSDSESVAQGLRAIRDLTPGRVEESISHPGDMLSASFAVKPCSCFRSTRESDHPPKSLGKLALPRNQAHHKITFLAKVVEVSGMNVNIFLLQQLNGEVVIGAGGGNAEHGIPSAFHLQAAAMFLFRQLPVEFVQIFSNAPH